MKKIILTIAAVCGITAGAFAQGSLVLQTSTTAAGVSLTTTNVNTSSWYSGSMTLEVFAIQSNSPSQWTAAQADIAVIDSDWANGAAALAALIADGWVQQTVGGGLSTNVTVGTGIFNIGTQTIGTSGTLPTSASTLADTIYAVLGIAGVDEGVIVFGPSATGAPSPGTPVNDASIWPNENLLLTPVPEPTTMALAGLGSAALLFLRRKKA